MTDNATEEGPVAKTVETLKGAAGAVESELTQVVNVEGMDSLYKNKYEGIFLQYPLNLDSSEESHWVRFDIQEIIDAAVSSPASARKISAGGSSKSSFLDKIVDGVSEKASALVTTAILAPINLGKSVATNFLNDLPFGIGGIGKDLLGLSGSGRAHGKGSIMIYAPHSRTENLKFNWNQEKTGLTGAGLTEAGGLMTEALQNLTSNKTLQSLKSGRHRLAQQVLSLVGGGMTGNPGAAASVTGKALGVSHNPHLAMFFDNIDFRTFTFDFKMAPRNSAEAKQIREITNLFKYAASPAMVDVKTGVYFAYPNVFDITFFNDAQTHKIARSALTGVSINHAASGVNSTFYDDYPVETSINLTFTELEIMHKDKIDEGY